MSSAKSEPKRKPYSPAVLEVLEGNATSYYLLTKQPAHAGQDRLRVALGTSLKYLAKGKDPLSHTFYYVFTQGKDKDEKALRRKEFDNLADNRWKNTRRTWPNGEEAEYTITGVCYLYLEGEDKETLKGEWFYEARNLVGGETVFLRVSATHNLMNPLD